MMATRGYTEVVRREGDRKVILETGTNKVRFCDLTPHPGEDSPDALDDNDLASAAKMVERLHPYFQQGVSIVRKISVAFRSAKVASRRTFAERNAT